MPRDPSVESSAQPRPSTGTKSDTPPSRGTGRRDALLAALALGGVLVAMLWGSLFGGKILTQADALYQFAPWSAVAPTNYQPSNELLLDQSTGFLPWLDFQAEQIRKFELPLWNPYNFCGEPLVGTYQSALYWPINWIYFLWPSWHTHAWMALLRLWFAGFFTYLFLRRLGVASGAAIVGGLGYMLSGFMVAWLNHPHVSCALFLPAMLWMVERMSKRPGPREAALFAVIFGLQLLAGHVQTALHHGIFTAAYCGFFIIASGMPLAHRLRFAWWILAGVGLGVLLAAPQLIPFLEYLKHSQAIEVFESMETVGREGVSSAAVLMLDPNFYGAPHTHDYTGPLGPNLNYNELIGGYVGRVLVVLAVAQSVWIGWRRKSRGITLFFLVVVVISGLVAFQVDPFYSFFDSIPRLRSTKLMRVLQFVAFGLAILGAMGLERLVSRFRYRALAIFAVFAMIAGEQLWFARGYNPEVDRGLLIPQMEVTDFLQREQGLHRTLGVDNSILKPNANLFYRINMVSGYDSMEDKRLSDLVLKLTSTPPKYPFISQIGVFNRTEAFPLMNLMGIRFFLSDFPLPEPLRKTLSAEVDVYENPNVMPRAFLASDTRVIPDSRARLEYLGSSTFDPWTAVIESPLRRSLDPKVDKACSSPDADHEVVEITNYAPNRVDIRVRTARTALLVLTDVWDRGWRGELVPTGAADVSGRPVEIHRVDHAFRGVVVEPGDWTVRFHYEPLSTRLGGWLAGFALLGLVLLALQPRHRRLS